MKLFGSMKKLINKTIIRDNVLSLEVIVVDLVQFNFVDNQYQQKSEVLYTFTPNKSSSYLLNVGPNNVMFLKTLNTEFDEIIKFTDKNSSQLEMQDKFSLTLVINKWKWHIIL